MSHVSNKYFSTGEFAKLFGIHKKTLFHYDEIGLFHPEKVLDNGYRYYSTDQVELFDIILQLKNMGLPLKEIKYFIDHRSPEMAIDFFTKEQAQIDAQIKRLESLKKSLIIKTQLLKASLDFPTDITLEEHAEEILVLSPKVTNVDTSLDFDIHAYTQLMEYCNTHELGIGYPVGGLLSIEKLYNHQYYNFDYYFIKTDTMPTDFKHIKPAGHYIVGYLKGFYDKTPLLYDKMLDFAKSNNFTLEGYSYEETIVDLLAVQNPEDIVTKISIKVSTTNIYCL